MIGESYRYLWEKVKDAREIHRIVPHKEEFFSVLHEEKFPSVQQDSQISCQPFI